MRSWFRNLSGTFYINLLNNLVRKRPAESLQALAPELGLKPALWSPSLSGACLGNLPEPGPGTSCEIRSGLLWFLLWLMTPKPAFGEKNAVGGWR